SRCPGSCRAARSAAGAPPCRRAPAGRGNTARETKDTLTTLGRAKDNEISGLSQTTHAPSPPPLVGEGRGGGWCREAPWCHIARPPPLTPPHEGEGKKELVKE